MSKYIDADAVIPQIYKDLNGCYNAGFKGNFHQSQIEEALEHIPAADVEPVRKWIPVDDKLPESGSDVLAYYDNGIEARVVPANFANGIWYDCIFNKTCHAITHWMPLPGFPEGGGDSK